MREKISEVLELQAGEVSIKAKTNEKAGPEGRGEAISAQAVVLIEG
jgi:2C-methyl-D-erythritol 2,4-cyclodiphosphate synthase